jgi:hypothetical protein
MESINKMINYSEQRIQEKVYQEAHKDSIRLGENVKDLYQSVI